MYHYKNRSFWALFLNKTLLTDECTINQIRTDIQYKGNVADEKHEKISSTIHEGANFIEGASKGKCYNYEC